MHFPFLRVLWYRMIASKKTAFGGDEQHDLQGCFKVRVKLFLLC